MKLHELLNENDGDLDAIIAGGSEYHKEIGFMRDIAHMVGGKSSGSFSPDEVEDDDYGDDDDIFGNMKDIERMFLQINDHGFSFRAKIWYRGDLEGHVDVDAKMNGSILTVEFDAWGTENVPAEKHTAKFDLSNLRPDEVAHTIESYLEKVRHEYEDAEY